MRTTIEITPAHRASLLRLAAERGEKGFSGFVREALDAYLANRGEDQERLSAQRLRGALSKAEADQLAKRVKALREDWR